MHSILLEPLFIDGRRHDARSGRTMTSINPANGEVIAEVQIAGPGDLEAAIDSAARGQRIWAGLGAMARSRILRRAVRILRDRNDELARLETLDTGKPFAETSTVDIATGADVLEYFAGLAVGIEGQQVPLRDTAFFYTRREPIGIVGAIGAWNYPIQIALWKSAPALAAGNAMIFKPSEVTPLTALKLAEIYTEAGLPHGVFNVLQGPGPDIGRWMTEHPRIDKISFTGGVATGKAVMASAAASSLKDVTMELGGKSPLIVFPDADIGQAADIAMVANFYSSGQVCTNGTRVFVPRSLKAAFEAAVLERVGRVRAGDPLDSRTNFGPLASFAHRDKVLGLIVSGKAEGATLLTGGAGMREPPFDKGAWVQPTVFTDCDDAMQVVREEVFGPVMCILTYDSEEEAIRRANDTRFGLAAGVVTRDLATGHRVIHRLQAGICWINGWGESPAEMPVGGYKESGVGRENGLQTLLAYTQLKSVLVELGPFNPVF